MVNIIYSGKVMKDEYNEPEEFKDIQSAKMWLYEMKRESSPLSDEEYIQLFSFSSAKEQYMSADGRLM